MREAHSSNVDVSVAVCGRVAGNDSKKYDNKPGTGECLEQGIDKESPCTQTCRRKAV